MRTVAVMNEKGGSAKTTATISVAAVLAERGYRISGVRGETLPPVE